MTYRRSVGAMALGRRDTKIVASTTIVVVPASVIATFTTTAITATTAVTAFAVIAVAAVAAVVVAAAVEGALQPRMIEASFFGPLLQGVLLVVVALIATAAATVVIIVIVVAVAVVDAYDFLGAEAYPKTKRRGCRRRAQSANAEWTSE